MSSTHTLTFLLLFLLVTLCTGAHEEDIIVNFKQGRTYQEKERATRKLNSLKQTLHSQQQSIIDSLTSCPPNLNHLLTTIHAPCCLLRTTCYRYKCNLSKSDCDSLFRSCAEAKCLASEDPGWCANQWNPDDGIAVRALEDSEYLGCDAWQRERGHGGCAHDEPPIEEGSNIEQDDLAANDDDTTTNVQDDVERLLSDLGIFITDEEDDGFERNVVIHMDAHRHAALSKKSTRTTEVPSASDSEENARSQPPNEETNGKPGRILQSSDTSPQTTRQTFRQLSIVDMDMSMHGRVQEALKRDEYYPPVMESISLSNL